MGTLQRDTTVDAQTEETVHACFFLFFFEGKAMQCVSAPHTRVSVIRSHTDAAKATVSQRKKEQRRANGRN